MKLINYIPPFLQNIREFKLISTAEDIELEALRTKIDEILKEVIVESSKNYGLERYEKIYNIKNTSTDIETRRFNILNKINSRIPYSLNWLRNKLNLAVGNDNYIITMDYDNYKIRIEISALYKDIVDTFKEDLREQLPCNLVVVVDLFQNETCEAYFGSVLHTGDYIELREVR